MAIRQVFQSLRGRTRRIGKSKVYDFEKSIKNISLGAANFSYEMWGQRLLLNDGEVVGVEESIF